MSALVDPNPISREPGRPASTQVSWHLRIEVDDLSPSPNRRMHWACRRRILKPLVDSIAWQARAASQGLPGKQPLQHAHVVAKMVHRKPPLRDWDNCVSSLKECIDALITGGLIVSDSPEHFTMAVVQSWARIAASALRYGRWICSRESAQRLPRLALLWGCRTLSTGHSQERWSPWPIALAPALYRSLPPHAA